MTDIALFNNALASTWIKQKHISTRKVIEYGEPFLIWNFKNVEGEVC